MLPQLSPAGQDFYEKQDIDGILYDWQIPNIHLAAYNELKSKGYLVPTAISVVGAPGPDGKIHTGQRPGFKFADAIIQAKDEVMYRGTL
jgi:hypothetical protein